MGPQDQNVIKDLIRFTLLQMTLYGGDRISKLLLTCLDYSESKKLIQARLRSDLIFRSRGNLGALSCIVSSPTFLNSSGFPYRKEKRSMIKKKAAITPQGAKVKPQ